jgi:hypothetical protein
LHADPNETTGVAAGNAALVKELGERIDQWRTLHPRDGVRLTTAPPEGWKAPELWAEAAR